jgi:putative oxidoreductase
MTSITRTTEASTVTAIAILRIVTGIIFFAHGYQKVFVYGPAGVAQGFAGMHIPAPAITSILIAAIELLGGAALILGFGTRIAAALLACDMLGAILLVHGRNGFFLPTGFEFALTLLAASVALVIAGAGSASIDRVLSRKAA